MLPLPSSLRDIEIDWTLITFKLSKKKKIKVISLNQLHQGWTVVILNMHSDQEVAGHMVIGGKNSTLY